MKILKAVFFLVSFFFFTQLNAQQVNYWKGGAIDGKHDWNNPKNWSLNKVPDWTNDMVVIEDVDSTTGCYPVIKGNTIAISHLKILGNAKLEISEGGKLKIDGFTTYNYGIELTGELINKGKLIIRDTGLDPVLDNHEGFDNQGIALLDEQYLIGEQYVQR